MKINFGKTLALNDEKIIKLGVEFILSLIGLIAGILLATLLVTTMPWVLLPIGVAVASFLGLTATISFFSAGLKLSLYQGLFKDIEDNMNTVFDIVYSGPRGMGTFLSYKRDIQDDWLPGLWGYNRPQNVSSSPTPPSSTSDDLLTKKFD